MTKRIRKIFIKSSRKSAKNPQNLHFLQDFARFFPPTKSKMPQRFWQKAKRRAFLNFSEEGLLSIFGEVLELFGLVGQVGQVRKVVKRAAYRISQTNRTRPTCQTCPTSQKVAAEHSPLWGRWRGLFLVQISQFFPIFVSRNKTTQYESVPFSPHCRTALHHGGIGTTLGNIAQNPLAIPQRGGTGRRSHRIQQQSMASREHPPRLGHHRAFLPQQRLAARGRYTERRDGGFGKDRAYGRIAVCRSRVVQNNFRCRHHRMHHAALRWGNERGASICERTESGFLALRLQQFLRRHYALSES